MGRERIRVKTILATGEGKIDRYIITTHQDFLILAQVENADQCIAAVTLHGPDLVVISDLIFPTESLEKMVLFLDLLKNRTPEVRILFIITRNQQEWTCLQKTKPLQQGVGLVFSPVRGRELSRALYEISESVAIKDTPSLVAVWSPKPGDGASFTTEAVSYALWKNREKEEEAVGVLDFDIKTPFLKYRFGLEESSVIDSLLPYIEAGKLSPEIVYDYAPRIARKVGLGFIGGIKRPEFYRRYNAIHFNAICDTTRCLYSKVVVDAGNVLDNAGTITALKNADLILALIQPDPISYHCLIEGLEQFPAYGINPNKVNVIVNRVWSALEEDYRGITTGLRVKTAGCLRDLGSHALTARKKPLFFQHHSPSKEMTTYLQSLQNILTSCGLVNTAKESNKQGLLQKLLVRSVQHVGRAAL
jgi:MinD-like ATPase involved in chromosome partitioning or flagellar assembly